MEKEKENKKEDKFDESQIVEATFQNCTSDFTKKERKEGI